MTARDPQGGPPPRIPQVSRPQMPPGRRMGPATGPMPAPPQQAAVETALIKNVLGAVTGPAGNVRPAVDRLGRDLALALRKSS